MRRKIFRWLKVIIIIYCVIGILIYYLQDNILFRPEALPAEHVYHFNDPFREINIPYSRETNINIIQFQPKDSLVKGVVLYFHGNRENIGRYAPYANVFTRNHYEVWMIDYPGYGKSTGEFTEQVLYDWSLVFYKLARARFSPDSIILYGKSMGTGIAAQLASVRDCKALVLETPYYSFPSIIGSYVPIYPLQRMIRFKIPTWQYLQEVTAPVAILHGANDRTIPYRNAHKLRPYLKSNDQFITIDNGGHNNLSEFPEYQQTLDSLLHK